MNGPRRARRADYGAWPVADPLLPQAANERADRSPAAQSGTKE